MYSQLMPQLATQGHVYIFGGRWTLTLCRACSTACTRPSCRYRSPERQIKRLSPLQTAAHHSTFQSSLYKSKYLIHRDLDLAVPYYYPSYSQQKFYDDKRQSLLSPSQSSHSIVLNHRLSNHILGLQSRNFHISSAWLKEESKVEKTVKALKDSAKEASEKEALGIPEHAKMIPAKKTLMQRLVATIKHYYHGFRLLFIDIRICSKLIWNVLNGESLTRREYNQLVRTTADMFRLLPMLVFILVPFAEFLLPVVLHLFPNMLPSTFKEEKDEKEAVKKNLKAKIEMAKFLQETIKESAVEAKKKDGQTAESFAMFLEKIQDDSVKPNNKDIMKFAKLFEDEITLDNLTRQQLRACCIMLHITPLGSDALLRFLLRMKLRGLLADDKMIQKEGIDSLTISELQVANRARGMRALGMSEERLRSQLQQWLQLHLDEEIPTSLLLLSRALYLPETLSTEEKIGATITQLADTAAEEAKVKVAEISGEKVDNKTKLEIIKHEEEIIAAEKEQLKLEKKLKEEEEREIAEALAAETAMQADLKMDDTARMSDELVDRAPELKGVDGEVLGKEAEREEEVTAEDYDTMETVLEEVAKERKIVIEHDALKDLKEDRSEYKEDLEDLKDVAVELGSEKKEFAESKAVRRLNKKVERMISRLDTVVDNLTEEKTDIQEKMTLEQDTLQKEKQLKEELDTDYDHVKEQIDRYKSNIVNINELLDAVKRMKNIPTDSKLRRVFEVLDEDMDGNIDINLALKVLELLSQEHLKLSDVQVKEFTRLLQHEAQLEIEDRKREKEEKEEKEQLKLKEEAKGMRKEETN